MGVPGDSGFSVASGSPTSTGEPHARMRLIFSQMQSVGANLTVHLVTHDLILELNSPQPPASSVEKITQPNTKNHEIEGKVRTCTTQTLRELTDGVQSNNHLSRQSSASH